MARPSFRVRPSAWQLWERFTDVPHSLTDVVEAMERLPESELEVVREFRPPAVAHDVRGMVFGTRFRIRGIRAPDGRWLEVWSVWPIKEPWLDMLDGPSGGLP